ncbi:MAG: hypothetical protein OHK0028_22210 [Deltaproteobacteria bacterium]
MGADEPWRRGFPREPESAPAYAPRMQAAGEAAPGGDGGHFSGIANRAMMISASEMKIKKMMGIAIFGLT